MRIHKAGIEIIKERLSGTSFLDISKKNGRATESRVKGIFYETVAKAYMSGNKDLIDIIESLPEYYDLRARNI